MSVVIKTLTPFTECDVLIEALTSLNVSTIVNGINIVTDRHDYQGQQCFVWNGDTYLFQYDSDELNGRIVNNAIHRQYTPTRQFLSKLEIAYKTAYQLHLARLAEAERLRLEQERLARVEAVRVKAIAKAKAQGYRVKEQKKNGKIQLVLTRTI
ncbi:hypothetical protein [Aliivibrio sp. 1S128]|uniref:hypothetical protein n=1 Tax=Aliivibrio sp. 1S128 TaxID=1840085 RepID=UPI00080E4D36|nr:hypothetical protein [Aliivibrio sp. 1S128]OCH25835.1 hypothetical protein A6E03_00030 [Aliivibrio sp. 1S128]